MKEPERTDLPVDAISIQIEELPKLVRLTRSDGEHKYYELKPAGKSKFGACLQGLPESIQRLFRRP